MIEQIGAAVLMVFVAWEICHAIEGRRVLTIFILLIVAAWLCIRALGVT